MSTTPGFRHRILTVMGLGALTSALSLIALVRIMSVTTALRVEHAREDVREEAHKLAVTPPAVRREMLANPASTIVGLRAGVLDPNGACRAVCPMAEVPREWRATLDEARRRARAANTPVVIDHAHDETHLVIAVEPLGDGGSAWAGFLVQRPGFLRTWQLLVLLLTLATALLVATAVHSVIAVRRGAAELHGAIGMLALDLGAPIPRPAIRELSEIADGIADLAAKLAQSREAQERLGHELAQQERLAALGRVVAGVAHEVRNPLASIKLRLDLAAASAQLPAGTQQALAHASTEIERLDRLVADLLLVAGRAMNAPVPASLGALAQARVEALGPWAATRQVTLSVHGDARAALDADSLGRAIDNLLRNAVEASRSGDVVEVIVEAAPGGASLRVEDRGAGVAPERVSELFEPFFTTKPAGTGLGLAISRAIARAHGGDLVYERRGAVTRFQLTLAGAARA